MTQQNYPILLAAAAVAIIGGITAAPKPAAACNTEPYIGTICTFAFDWCPMGYLPADGRTLVIQQNQALFGLLGFRYGGDNQTNFKIPDLRGRVPIGKGQGGGLPVNVTMGANYGQQQQVLDFTQTPVQPHTHPATFVGTGGGGSGTPQASGTVNLPVTGSASGSFTSPITGGAVSGVSLSGSLVVNGFTTQTTGGAAAPVDGTTPVNTLGKNSSGPATNPFYPYDSTKAVPLPVVNTLAVSGGTVSGDVSGTITAPVSGTASGTVTLPLTGATGITGGTVTVGNNSVVPATAPVNMMPPSIGMSVCIAVQGLYPNRP